MRRSYSEEKPEYQENHLNVFASEKNKCSIIGEALYRSDSSEIEELNSQQSSLYGSIMTCENINEETSDDNGMILPNSKYSICHHKVYNI